jgi:hypothetical protein
MTDTTLDRTLAEVERALEWLRVGALPGKPRTLDIDFGMVLVAEVNRLRADLALNAQMLARQTDLAREAERNAHHVEQAMSSHLPSLDRSALLTQIDALKADLAEMTKQRDLDVDRAREAEAEVERLRTEHQDAWTRLNTLNAQIADLSHPNMQMLLRDCERLRAERGLELAEVARLQALVPVPPNDPRTCDHSWYVFDGSAHCYMCNETRHSVPSVWTGV